MSYSFTFNAANKVEAKEKVAAELAKVVQAQPIHKFDEAQAQAAAIAFIDLLPDDDSKEVYVSVSGSVGWSGTQEAPELTSAGIHVGTALMVKESRPAHDADEQPSA